MSFALNTRVLGMIGALAVVAAVAVASPTEASANVKKLMCAKIEREYEAEVLAVRVAYREKVRYEARLVYYTEMAKHGSLSLRAWYQDLADQTQVLINTWTKKIGQAGNAMMNLYSLWAKLRCDGDPWPGKCEVESKDGDTFPVSYSRPARLEPTRAAISA